VSTSIDISTILGSVGQTRLIFGDWKSKSKSAATVISNQNHKSQNVLLAKTLQLDCKIWLIL